MTYRQHDPSSPRTGGNVAVVDSYLTGTSITRISSIDYGGLDLDTSVDRGIGHEGSRKKSNDATPKSRNGTVTLVTPQIPEVPGELPGLSLITWEEFVEAPSLLHNLFTLEKDDFIHFDSSLVCIFFHDSRMEPPTLGGPSGDGASWTIFVDEYSQLRQIRETLTSRISVLLVDLVKPDGAGTAACLVAINPQDEQIRRGLHLTLSKAMESVFNDRCFSLEIDLNSSIQQWCQDILQQKCDVYGGKIIITNGDALEPCCEWDSPAYCVLCFPVWATRKLRYLISRRRHYDDTRLEFDASGLTLCSKSNGLASGGGQLTSGQRLLRPNQNSVTAGTQTNNLSVLDLDDDFGNDEALDNDVIRRREVVSRTGFHDDGHSNPVYEEESDGELTDYGNQRADLDSGVTNVGFSPDSGIVSASVGAQSMVQESRKKGKGKSVMFKETVETENSSEASIGESGAVELVAKANAAPAPPVPAQSGNYMDEKSRPIPSPRSAFMARPDTPFTPPEPRPRTTTTVTKLDPIHSMDIEANKGNSSNKTITAKEAKGGKNDDINDKLARRQKKISALLKDLVLSSSSSQIDPKSRPNTRANPEEGVDEGFEESTKFPDERGQLQTPEPPKLHHKPLTTETYKVKRTPVKSWDSQTDRVFPYTSDLLSFPNLSSGETRAALEKYGAKHKKNSKNKKAEDMLFHPRLNLDIGPDRNCFSDQDIADSDITDLETEPENAVSDTEGITSSRLIPVRNTDRTYSMDSVTGKGDSRASSDQESELEITDCEVEEEELARKLRGPRILPGAQAAHELRANSAGKYGRSRDYIPPSAQARRRGGQHNDSRRRYLALNSLRRKAYKLALQSQIRNQPRPQSAQLLSYNPTEYPVTIMSQV